MFVLGLILILLSAGALVAVLSSGTDDQAALYGGSLQMPTLVVFLAGAAALLLFIIGLELTRSGVSRANRNRKNNKRLRRLERREQERRASQDEPTTAGTGTGPTDASHRSGEEPTRTTDGPDGSTQAPPTAR